MKKIVATVKVVKRQQLKFKLKTMFYVVLMFSLFMIGCSDNHPTSSASGEKSLSQFNANQSNSLASRASIANSIQPLTLLISALENPGVVTNTVVNLDNGILEPQSHELQSLTIDNSINATLLNTVTEGTYELTFEFSATDPIYGSTIIAQTTEEFVTIFNLVTELSPISVNSLIFPDSDNDGVPNIDELLAGTDFNNAQSQPIPTIPNNVEIAQNISDIQISWDSVTGANSYNVYVTTISPNESSQWVTYTATSSSIKIDNILSSGVYDVYAVVSAVNAAGEGLSSPQISLSGVNNSVIKSNTVLSSSGLVSIEAALPAPILRQSPSADSIDVKVSKSISVRYDPLPNITKVWLELTGIVPVIGTIKESTGKIKFYPDSLDFSTTYTASVTVFQVDAAGATIESTFQWSFTTVADILANADTTPPRVSGLTPRTDDVDVRTDSDISISFSEPVDPQTLNSGVSINFIDQTATTTSVNGRWGTRVNTAVFTPTAPLPADTTIWVAVETVADLAGNQVQSRFGSNFRTRPGPGTVGTLFTLNNSNPAADQIDVAVNTNLTFDFSDNVDLTALTTDQSIQLIDPTGAVVRGNWQEQGKTVIFNPRGDLQTNGAVYVVQISGAVKSLTGNLITGAPISWPFYTKLAAVVNNPFTWTTAKPLPGKQDVPIASEISLTFSAPVDLNSLTGGSGINITDQTNGLTILGVWRSLGNDIIFTPSSPLKYRAQHLTKIGTGVMDLNGVSIPGRLEMNFVTERLVVAADTTAPTWMGASPGLNEQNVSVKAEIVIKFDEKIDEQSVQNHTGIRVHGPSGATIPGKFYRNGNKIDFRPSSPMEYDSQYAIYLTTLTKDLAGNALDLGPGINDTHWVFYTEKAPVTVVSDTTAPMLMGFSPGLDATLTPIPVTTLFSVKFSEPVDLASIMSGTTQTGIKIIGPTGVNVPGSWVANGNEVIFAPFSLLEYNGAQYILMITGGVTDLAGNPADIKQSILVVVITENAPL